VAVSEDFERCVADGGVVLFPADTVYGLACDPENPDAVRRLYELKGRPPSKAAAVMCFQVEFALAGVPPRTAAAARTLLPGPVTLLVPDPHIRFPLAGGERVLGLRVPDVPLLAGMRRPVLQSSANEAGEPDARRLADVPAALRDAVDLVIDGGELPGTPSTVVDLSTYEDTGEWTVLREGALTRAAVADRLAVCPPHS
jgi:L-threonylcarbamoyladenylate synthase